MKKIYLLFLTALLVLPWASKLEAQVTYYSKAAATDFNDVNTWGTAADGTGTSPAVISTADSFVVQNNSLLTLNADAGIRYLTINAGTLTVSANTLTVEVPTQNNSKIIVTNGGQLNFSGGNIICNGAVYFANGSGFNQSGGLLKIDPNSGTAATSIGGAGNTAAKTFGIGYGADGVVTSTITPAANVAKFTLTGGSIQIVDPPLTTSTTAYSVAVHTGTALNFGTGHTLKFGDGVSTQAAGSANGFYVYLWQGSSYGVLGNVEVDVLTGTNRWVKTTGSVGILGNLNIVSGEIWNISNLYLNGNIVNNGIFTIGSVLYFGSFLNATAAASTNAQTVTGTGTFRNSQTTITANANSLTVNNSNASGVTLLGTTNIGTQPTGSFSISSTLTFVAGKLTTTGTSVVLGVSSGTPTAGTLTYTAGGFTSGTLFGRSWTAAGTGTAITAGTDPTTATSRFPFITAAGAGRSAWIQRVTPSAAGITFIQYNESAGTTAVSITDGAYTANTRSNDNWVVSRTNADAATYNLVIVAPGVYVSLDNSSRVVRSADVVGNYQQGTITPGGQRVGLASADLVNTFYLAITNPTCFVPTGLTNGVVTTNSAAFSWTAPAPVPASGYDYYVSTSNTAPTTGTTPTGSTTPGVTNAVAGGLAANTLHYFWVRSNCGAGDLSSWAGPGSFYTGYCVPAATSTATYINNFSTTGGSANISNLASGFTTGGYQDNYATMGAAITAGSNLNFTLDYVGGTLGAAIWVDFNNNLIFESSERLYNTTAYTASGAVTLSATLAIPGATVAGDYRMRVLVDYNAPNPTNSCGFVSGRGEVEDYKLTVAAQPTDAMDWVNLQFPATATIAGGGTATVYTRGYEAGVTDPAGAGAGIIVWIGISPSGAAASSDPATWSNWVPATFNVQSGNDDEFQAAIGSSLAVGTYQYASRWQLNGGPYRYGGYNATGGGLWDGTNNVSGVLTVNPSANDNICSAVSLSVSGNPTCTTSLTGQSTQYATQSLAGCLGTADDDIWYSFVATNITHIITLTSSGAGSTDRVHQLFSSSDNTCSGTLTSLNCSDPETSTVNGLTIGNTYFLRVHSYSSGNFATFDICITSPAACPAPTGVSANSITSSGATINFTGTGTFILEYGLTGFTPGTGATAGVGGTIINPATSPQAITGLANTTTYQVYVRQDCTGAGNGFSANSTVASFTTLAPPPITSVTSGDWNTGSTWSSGMVPVCGDNIQINATHNVTITSAGNVSKLLTIATGGTLTVNSGDLTVGCTLNNSSLNNNGTLTITGGTVWVNGRVALNSPSTYNMSGGNLNIDPNDGTAIGSVASGTATFAIGSSSSAMTSNVTGGNILINDPPFAGTGYSVVMNTNTSATWTGSTIQFGGTSNTNVSTATNGFRVDCYLNSGRLAFGNVIINGNDVAKPVTDVSYGINAAGDLIVNSGSELRIATSLSSFAGNITNNGIITATSAMSLQLVNGLSTTAVASPNAQTIGGSGVFRNLGASPTADLNGLTVNNSNSAGVTLAVPLRLSGTFTLTAGLVNTTSSNLLTVGTSGTNLGTISRTAGMVKGPLKKWYAAATGSATLPLGDGVNYKPATLNFTTAPATTGTLTGNFSSVAPNFPNVSPLMEGALVVNKASIQGSWFVEAGDGLTGGNYTATFTGNGSTDVIDFTKTVLIKRPTAGGDWTLDGVHVTSTGSNAAPVVSRTGMSGFSEFAIGGELLVALPISIQYFKGSKQNNGHLLDWKVTCYNSPSVTMLLERSADGRKFTSINNQTETSLRCLQPFSFTDAAPLAGINYYRLKSVDIDGKESYSKIVALLNKDKGFEIVSLVPNPVKDEAVLSVSSAVKSIIEIVVSDLSGKQLNKQRVTMIAGNNLLPINVRNLPAGIYQVTGITADGMMRTLRFVKQ